MSHGAICPCPNCSGGGKGCLALLVLAAVALAVGAGFAVQAALHWLAAHVVDDALMACPLVMTGFGLAWKARERSGKVRRIAAPGAAGHPHLSHQVRPGDRSQPQPNSADQVTP